MESAKHQSVIDEIHALLVSKNLSIKEAEEIAWGAYSQISALRNPVMESFEQRPLKEFIPRT